MAAPRNENLRAQILEGASALLQEKSFNEISLADVSQKAKVSKGTLYYYYQSKSDLLCDIADGYIEGMLSELMTWVEDKQKDTSVPRMLRYIIQYGVNDPGRSLRLHLTAEAVSGNEEIRERLLRKYQVFHDVFEEKLRERLPGEDGDYYAWLILTVIDGLLIQNLLQNANIDIPAFIEKLIARLTSCSLRETDAPGE